MQNVPEYDSNDAQDNQYLRPRKIGLPFGSRFDVKNNGYGVAYCSADLLFEDEAEDCKRSARHFDPVKCVGVNARAGIAN